MLPRPCPPLHLTKTDHTFRVRTISTITSQHSIPARKHNLPSVTTRSFTLLVSRKQLVSLVRVCKKARLKYSLSTFINGEQVGSRKVYIKQEAPKCASQPEGFKHANHVPSSLKRQLSNHQSSPIASMIDPIPLALPTHCGHPLRTILPVADGFAELLPTYDAAAEAEYTSTGPSRQVGNSGKPSGYFFP